MTQEELGTVLEKHKKFLETGDSTYKAKLRRANLLGTDLLDVNLSSSNLCRANLSGSNLCRVNLSYTDLTYANLSYADLSYVNLSGANLFGANIRGANFDGVIMRESKNIASFNACNLNRLCIAVRHANCVMFSLGRFWGNTEEAVESIRTKYGYGSTCEELILLYTKILMKDN